MGTSVFKTAEEELVQASKAELIALIQRQNQEGQKLLTQTEELKNKTEGLKTEVDYLKGLNEQLQAKLLVVEGQLISLKTKYFGKAKNRPASAAARDKKKKKKEKKKPRRKLPSERYPDALLIEKHVELEQKPDCSCCGSGMTDSGMTEDTEYLSVIPAQYLVIRIKRHKYRCGKCHADIKTAPSPPRIYPGSVVGDELAVDVALSKYCDLIPIERYCSIAGRSGLKDLPHQILIESTHYLAAFVGGAYKITREEILSGKLLHADETTHRMLEGDVKKGWYLWGFLNPERGVYFEIKGTRSGDIASYLLVEASCSHMMSDAYTGYGKALREANEIRKKEGLPPILCLYCNAHAIRKFKEAQELLKEKNLTDPEIDWFVAEYQKIYDLDDESIDLDPDEVMKLRKEMASIFKEMKIRAEKIQNSYPSDGKFGKALSYFVDHYDGLILFTSQWNLPIDNNVLERQLRNPVVGRKTWLGTHSPRGAQTAAVLFTLVETCKLLKINPREYFKILIEELHQGKSPFSPYQFKMRQSQVAA
jgi:transposase